MDKETMDKKIKDEKKKKDPKENVLNVVKEFISYFEEIDRSEEDDNCIKRS